MDTIRILGTLDTLRAMRRWLVTGPDDKVRLRLCPIRLEAGPDAADKPDRPDTEEARETVLAE